MARSLLPFLIVMTANTAIASATRPSTTAQQLVLDNGLTAVWEVDHRQPLVAIEVRILGGLRGEGRYLGTGITHAIEHMLFKGTTSRAPGMIDQEVRRYGGTINAFTSHDFTGVDLFVESRFLREALGMVADILQHATFPDEEFAKERRVIISEIQMNRDDPDRRLQQLFWSREFLFHPYRHPILGYQPQLEQLTAEDLRTLYRSQYMPNNVVVACVGDLDASAFPQLLRDAFGAWPRGTPPVMALPEEPPQMSPRQSQETLPLQASYALLGFPSTRLASPDLYALDVLAGIVGHGRSSRLYEELVRRRRIAQLVDAANYTPLDPGAWTIYLRTEPKDMDAALKAAVEVLEQVKARGVSAQELKKVKRQVVADYLFGHQTIEAKAQTLAGDMALTGDPTFADRYVEGVNGVTAQQVKEAAARYLVKERMSVARIEPPSSSPTSAVVRAPAAAGVTKTVLPNGLTVLLGVDHRLPIGTVVLVSRGGVRTETEQTQGLSNLTAQMLLKGTKHRSATEIAEYVESMGGDIAAFSGRDGFGMSLQLLSEDLENGIALTKELVIDSTFPDQELALQRDLILKELEARDDDIFDRAGRLLRQTLFPSHPYRFDPMGRQETVRRLSRADCAVFAAQHLTPRNMVLAVFGDFDEAAMLAGIRRGFGALPDRRLDWPQEIAPAALDGIQRASLTLPKEQSVIFLGFRGTRLAASDRDTLDVLAAVLSGMSGRLFQSVREKQGLSYTLGATNVPGWDPGYVAVYAATRPSERDQVLKTIQEQLEAILANGFTEEEVAQAKRYLIGNHRMSLQEISGMAKRAALDELYGLGYDAWRTYEARINAVTIPMLQEAARRYLTLPRRAEIVVGPNGASPE